MLSQTRWMAFLLSIGGGLLLASCATSVPSFATQTPEVQPTMTPPQAAPSASPTRVVDLASPTATPLPTATDTAQPRATPSPTPTPLVYNVAGDICYPRDTIPQMTLYFENTETESLVELPIPEGQDNYSVKLPPGTYIAYAWLTDFSLGGLYSRAVPCGLKEECDDHTLLPFTASETQILDGVDLCDWYAGPFNVPYPPGKEETEVTGVISGSLTYPDGQQAELRVVAFNTRTGYWYWVFASADQPFYAIQELPPGTYQLVAYDASGNAGGHADANHHLIEVVVEPGKVTEGVTINDWSAPEGSFPPDPTQ